MSVYKRNVGLVMNTQEELRVAFEEPHRKVGR
jgi:hypothetical protein